MTVALYLAAIVAANLSVAAFGPSAVIANAFLLIGLDLTVRDRLHDAWSHDQLVLRMGVLVFTGGAITYLLNQGAAQIAVASTVAFTAAAIVDGYVYHVLSRPNRQAVNEVTGWPMLVPRWSRLERINGSNLVGAAVDSLIFPTLAFGALLPAVVLGQFAAKVAGGFLWSLILAVPLRRRPV